jgi:LPS export ABC transporter protein LptC/lipopolysaccharide transport protein LptA
VISRWLNIAAPLAILMIGYSVLTNRDNDGFDSAQQQPQLLGYYVKDAIITETSATGAPRVRFAATELTQDLQDNSVTLASVRADYLWPADESQVGRPNGRTNHWVLNADRARIPARSGDGGELIELRGNVEAHSVNATHFATVSAPTLNIDTGRQVASTSDAVQVDIDGHTVNGRGLRVDMNKNHAQLKSDVTMRLAANKPIGLQRDRANDTPVSIPDLWESDSIDIIDNIVVLKNVRSKIEPFISANQLRANGQDLENNQVELTGAVRMELPKRGFVTADKATATIRDNRVVHVQLTGKPVNFQHQSNSSDEIVRGRGTTVDYDVTTQAVRFSGESWFSKAKYEYTSKSLLEYNIASETVHAGQSSMRVAPRKDAAAPADAPAGAPNSPATKP